MKKIASLLAASICVLALAPTATGASVGSSWASYDWPSLAGGQSPTEVSIVPMPVDPSVVKVPGILAKAWPKYQEAIAAVRSAIVEDPDLKAALDAKGLAPDKVIGITYQRNGGIAVLVSQA